MSSKKSSMRLTPSSCHISVNALFLFFYRFLQFKESVKITLKESVLHYSVFFKLSLSMKLGLFSTYLSRTGQYLSTFRSTFLFPSF